MTSSVKKHAVIRVILAEDQAMFLGALAALLDIEDDIVVAGQAHNGKEALDAVIREKADVLIADIEMPEMTGLEVAAELKRRKISTRTIILTTFPRPGYMRRALESGASGYLLKDRPAKELVDAVRRVNMGLRVIDPELAVEAWFETDPLTDRERQTLRLAGHGLPSSAIAKELGISEGTVRNHLSEAIQKLGATNRTDAARIARNKGWL
ncbi:MAG: response regulator transcription factor [Candidatus Acidiferrales bacterium]